jgi:hypothetical protein
VVSENNTSEVTKTEVTVEVIPQPDSSVEVVCPTSEVLVSDDIQEVEVLAPSTVEIEIVQNPREAPDIANVDIPRLALTKTYSETISALQVVTASSNTEVEVAMPDTLENSIVMGVALQTGITGFDGRIHILGILEDPSFNFNVNELLYLGENGNITNVPPSLPNSQFSTTIGYSLGTGAIFIKIEQPIELV